MVMISKFNNHKRENKRFAVTAGLLLVLFSSLSSVSFVFSHAQNKTKSKSTSSTNGSRVRNNLSGVAKNSEFDPPTLLETARLAQSLTTFKEWETLNVPNTQNIKKRKGTTNNLHPLTVEIPLYAEDASELIDRIFSLLLFRILAIIYDRSTIHGTNNLFLPEFLDLSTTTICHTILSTVDNSSEEEMNEWTWPKSMTPEFMLQLKDYVSNIISDHHNDVPYHNYKHAYHVFLSANKLLDLLLLEYEHDFNINLTSKTNITGGKNSYDKHNLSVLSSSKIFSEKPSEISATYKIQKDPFLHFSFLFSALTHDVDHRGLTNSQLIKAGDDLSLRHSKNPSVLEQQSLSVAFSLLDKPCYSALRDVLFSKTENGGREGREKELHMQFQSVVVNLVLNTDIASRERVNMFKLRLSEVFGDNQQQEQKEVSFMGGSSNADDNPSNFKAIVALQLLLNAADISSVLQGWETFIPNSCRLFQEQKVAFELKYGEDPGPEWHAGQTAFLEKHAMPFALQLRETSVFRDDVGKMIVKITEQNKKRWALEGSSIECGANQ